MLASALQQLLSSSESTVCSALRDRLFDPGEDWEFPSHKSCRAWVSNPDWGAKNVAFGGFDKACNSSWATRECVRTCCELQQLPAVLIPAHAHPSRLARLMQPGHKKPHTQAGNNSNATNNSSLPRRPKQKFTSAKYPPRSKPPAQLLAAFGKKGHKANSSKHGNLSRHVKPVSHTGNTSKELRGNTSQRQIRKQLVTMPNNTHIDSLRRCERDGLLKDIPWLDSPRFARLAWLPDWLFRHVFKSGGTSVLELQGWGPFTTEVVRDCVPTNRTRVFAVVRDPLERFISGYHEAMRRIRAGEYSLPRITPYNRPDHPLVLLANNYSMQAVERMEQLLIYTISKSRQPWNPKYYPEAHYAAAVRFLLAKGNTLIPSLAAVLEIGEMNDFANVTLGHNRRAKGAKDVDVNVTLLPHRMLHMICHVMIADYCCLDYSLPEECARWYDANSEDNQSPALIARVSTESRLWECARTKIKLDATTDGVLIKR